MLEEFTLGAEFKGVAKPVKIRRRSGILTSTFDLLAGSKRRPF